MQKLKICLNLANISVILCIVYQNVVNLNEVGALDHQKTGEQYATTIRHIPKNSWTVYKFEQSAVILCNDLEDIQEFNNKVKLTNRYAKKLKFLVICEKSILGKFPESHILSYKPGLMLEFQYFIVDKAGKLELSTYEWFLEEKCNEPQMIQLNSFSKTTLKWESQLGVKDKFMNLNQCPITLYINELSSMENCVLKREPISINMNFFKAFSSKGNFQRDYIYQEDQAHENYTRELQDKTQLTLIEKSFYYPAPYDSHITRTHTQAIMGFFISPSELYTSYEKLLMPFDELTWIFLIATFGFSFGFIFVIKKYAPWYVQNWIFGAVITSPAYNLIGIFFGISQVRVPVENSARFILISYLYFCLVIRTAYQGVFFEMFTHDLRKPQLQTIDDLYKYNYTIITDEVMDFWLESTFPKDRRPRISHNHESLDALLKGIVPEKLAYNMDLNLNSYAKDFFRIHNLEFLKQRLGSTHVGFRFPKNHFLFHIADEAILHLRSTGITDHLINYPQSVCRLSQNPVEDYVWEPKVFSIDDLLFGFNIWLATIGASLIVLALELTWFYGKRATIRVVESTVALYFILARVKRGFDN